MAVGKPRSDDFNNALEHQVTRGYQPIYYWPWHNFVQELPPLDYYMIQAMLLDPTVRLGLSMRVAPICAAEFAYQENGQWVPGIRSDNPEVADFVYRQLQRIWQFDIRKILRAQVWGWSAAEVVYETKMRNGRAIMEYDYMVDRQARDVRPLVKRGKPVGVEFRSLSARQGSGQGSQKGTMRLGVGKAIWLAFDPEAGSMFGRTIMQGPYSPFADKWFDGGALDVRRLYMHSEAYAGPIIGYPMEDVNVPGKGTIPAADIALQIAEQRQTGNCMTKPNVYDELTKQNKWTVEPGPASTSNPQHILQYPRDLDIEILRGLEIADDVIMSINNSGAWAGKQVPMMAFYASLNQFLNDAIKAITTWIMEPLVEWNFGPDQDFEITCKPLHVQALELQNGILPGQMAAQAPQASPSATTMVGAGQQPSAPAAAPAAAPEGEAAALPVEGAPAAETNPASFLRAQEAGNTARLSVDRGTVGPNGFPAQYWRHVDDDVTPTEILRFAADMMNQESYGCLMAVMDPRDGLDVLKLASTIPVQDLHDKGVEKMPHVTVLYGIHTDDGSEVGRAIRAFGPAVIEIGGLGMFEADDYDVLYMQVGSDSLMRMNSVLTESIDYTQTQPSYRPHVTLAYLKKGTGKNYVDIPNPMQGRAFKFDELVFSDSNRRRTTIPLLGPVRMSAGNWRASGGNKDPHGFQGWVNRETGKRLSATTRTAKRRNPDESTDEPTSSQPKTNGKPRKVLPELGV